MHHDNRGVSEPHCEEGLSRGCNRTSSIDSPYGEANTSLIESASGGMMLQDNFQAMSRRKFDGSQQIKSCGHPHRQLTLRQAPSHAEAAYGDKIGGETT